MRATKRKVSLGGGGKGSRVAPGHEDATPERLRHARRDGLALVGDDGVRRFADAFDELRTRQRLDRENAGRNDLLWQAGDRFRRHWHYGRLDSLAAFDFTRDSVDGTGGATATTPTEKALRHREIYRRAAEAVGSRLLGNLQGSVVEGKTLAALAPGITDTRHARTAEAIVLERLREALHRLCDHWGMSVGSPGSVAIRLAGPPR